MPGRDDRLRVVIGEDGSRVDASTGVVIGRAGEGKTIEELAEQEPLWSMPMVVGAQGALTGRVTGRAPTSSVLKLKGPELFVKGQFQEGDRIRMEVVFEVEDVDFKQVKSSGHVVGKKRVHTATLFGWRQLPDHDALVDAMVEAGLTRKQAEEIAGGAVQVVDE